MNFFQKVLIVPFLILGVISLTAVADDAPPAKAEVTAPKAEKKTAAKKAATVTKLIKKDLKKGKGATAEKGKTVSVHYTGRLLDGTKFDSSVDRGEPFSFLLGAGQVIRGWDDGVAGMKVGGKRKLTIPSDMAYGAEGRPPVIPQNAPLEFDVELLGVN